MVLLNFSVAEFQVGGLSHHTLRLKIFQNATVSAFDKLEFPIKIEILDFTSPVALEFYQDQIIVCRSTLFLLGLLTSEKLSITLYKDPANNVFSDANAPSSNLIILEFTRESDEISSLLTSIPTRAAEKGMHSLELAGIDTNSFMDMGRATTHQNKYLENLVVGLNTQFKSIERMNYYKSDALFTANRTISSISESLRKSSNPIRDPSAYFPDFSQIFSQHLKQTELLHKKLEESNAKLSKLDELVAENNILKARDSILKSQDSKISNLLKEINELKNSLSLSEKSYEEFKILHKQTISSFEQSTATLESNITELIDENSTLKSQIQALTRKLTDLHQQSSELTSEINRSNSENQFLSSKLLAFANLESQYNSSTIFSKLSDSDLTVTLQGRANITILSDQNQILLKKLRKSEKSKKLLEEQIKNQENMINLISVSNKNNLTTSLLDEKSKAPSDIPSISSQLERIAEISIRSEQKFYKESSKFFRQFYRMTLRHMSLHRLVGKILRLVFDKDCEIYLLRNLALDAQRERKTYAPIRNDPIDVCMAEFLNSRVPPLPFPVVREDQGVYLFASRTIKVKIENNKVIVRLGGGFEAIEGFVSTNMQAEIDKVEERRKFGAGDAIKNQIDQDLAALKLNPMFENKQALDPSLPSSEGSTFTIPNTSPMKLKKKNANPLPRAASKTMLRQKTMS